MIRGSTRFRWNDTTKSELAQVQFVDEYIDDAHWIVFDDVVTQMLGEQRALCAMLSLDKALHLATLLFDEIAK